jgi:hypothetical protein
MNVNQINAYLERAREIIGDRTKDEAAYDDAVVSHLVSGMNIKRAIEAANLEHPKEALRPRVDDWKDVAARYEYLAEHKAILTRLGIRE